MIAGASNTHNLLCSVLFILYFIFVKSDSHLSPQSTIFLCSNYIRLWDVRLFDDWIVVDGKERIRREGVKVTKGEREGEGCPVGLVDGSDGNSSR